MHVQASYILLEPSMPAVNQNLSLKKNNEAKIEDGSQFTTQYVRFPAAAGFFTFLYFCLITSKFLFIPT